MHLTAADSTAAEPDAPVAVETPEPVRPDAGDDRFVHERYRFALIARAMQAGSLTPNEAAAQVDRSIDVPFEISEQASSAPDLPGSIRPAADLTWLVMCRAETREESLAVPVDERLEADLLRAATAAYDPEFRQAKVIIGRSGPSHVTGRFEPPVGFIDAVQFDGFNCWALVRDDGWRLQFAVEAGAHDRSVFVRPESERPGNPPYFDHLALLYGEWPLQPNLTSLAHLYTPAGDEQELVRSEGWHHQRMQRGDAPMRNPNPTAPEIDGVDEEHRPLVRAILEGLGSFLSRSDSDSDDDAAAADAAGGGDASGSDPAPAAGDDRVAALERTVTELAGSVRSLTDSLTARQEADAESAQAAREARVTAALDRLQRSFRLTPAERSSWQERLLAPSFPAAEIDPTLETLAGRPSSPDLARSAVIDREGEEPVTATVPQNVLASPDGVVRADPQAAAVLARAKALAADLTASDPSQYHPTLRRLLVEGDSRLSAN